jgi:uncharacterized membrane protein YfcA
MQIYLPIAEMTVNFFEIFMLGIGVGVLSGIFGIGGGFLMTPVLIFLGIPTIVAVSTQSTQIMASSFSSLFSYQKKNMVDFKMAGILLIGGITGSIAGACLFKLLKQQGYIEIVITICYIIFLISVGTIMLIEGFASSIKRFSRQKKRDFSKISKGKSKWLDKIPLQTYFTQSDIRSSVIPPVVLGIFVGLLSALMGVGGGFILIPAMIYLLKMPSNTIVGTSLLNVLVISIVSTIMHSVYNQTIDGILSSLLIISSVIGAQIGVRLSTRLKAAQMRTILGILILSLGVILCINLVVRPQELFSLYSDTL